MLSRRDLIKHAAVTCAALPLASEALAMTMENELPARSAFVTPQYEVCLNNARWHPLSNGARKAVEAYHDYKAQGVNRQQGLTSPTSIAVKNSFANLIHATPDEIAYVQSTTAGENLVVSALGLTHPGDFNIVTDALHFEGSLYLYTQLQQRGVQVRIVKPRVTTSGAWIIDPTDIEKAVDSKTKLIAVSLVSWVNGFTHNAKQLADLAHAHGAKLYLDVVQAAGVVPIDVQAIGVDFLAAATYKWLMGDFGLGFLYARKSVLPSLQRTQWSFRQFSDMEYHTLPGDKPGTYPASFDQLETAAGYFELGTYSNAVLAALSYSLPWLQQLGIHNIQQHAHTLHTILRKEMPGLGYACITPEDAQAAILSFSVHDDATTAAKLKKANVDVSLIPGRMRVSPSVYNNEADIHALLNALA